MMSTGRISAVIVAGHVCATSVLLVLRALNVVEWDYVYLFSPLLVLSLSVLAILLVVALWAFIREALDMVLGRPPDV